MSNPALPFAEVVRERATDLARLGVSGLGPLYDLTAQRLVRYASMVTRQQQDAEDAVHTALAKLADRPLLLLKVNSPWAYLLRIVRNEALLISRRNARIQCSGTLSDLATYCRVDDLEREDSFRQVWLALRRLPREQSEVIALKIWESMTFAEIAGVLDISPNTAASRYRYGMQRVAAILKPLAESCHD